MIDQAKNALRNDMRKLLGSIHCQELIQAGLTVATHIELWLKKTFGDKSLAISYFKSFKDEIDTSALEKLLIKKAAVRALPLVTAKDEIAFIKPQATHASCATGFENGLELDPQELNVIFVPGLAFDTKGHRLGRGKGHFDRALARLLSQKRPIFMGLAMDQQVVKALPHEAHDVPMDFICTPKLGVMKAKRD